MNGALYFFVICVYSLFLQTGSVWSSQITYPLAKEQSAFAAKLIKNLAQSHAHTNVIFSPLSIHSAMTLLYLAAEGKTAEELEEALSLSTSDKPTIGLNYAEFLNATFAKQIPDFVLNMINGLVVNERYQISDSFAEMAKRDLNTRILSANFDNGDSVVRAINDQVERYTNSKITDLMKEGSINDLTCAVLLNVLYLESKWERTFDETYTKRSEVFQLDADTLVEVDMMYNSGRYRYGKSAKLNATVVELPFKDTDLSMLIILPHAVDGLENLEHNIGDVDWNEIASTLSAKDISLFLPKFRIDFEMDVKEQLMELGVRELFDDADLSALFQNNQFENKNLNESVYVSQSSHKAYLEINEYGVEAAGATVALVERRARKPTVLVDHPFMFVIRSPEAVFFIGHVAKF